MDTKDLERIEGWAKIQIEKPDPYVFDNQSIGRDMLAIIEMNRDLKRQLQDVATDAHGMCVWREDELRRNQKVLETQLAQARALLEDIARRASPPSPGDTPADRERDLRHIHAKARAFLAPMESPAEVEARASVALDGDTHCVDK